MKPRGDAVEALTPLARHFAACIARRCAGDAEQRALAANSAALLATAVRDGHSCLRLADWAGRPSPLDGERRLPDAEAWTRGLRAAALLDDDGGAIAPFVAEGGLLYLLRHWRAERRVAAALGERLRAPARAVDPEALRRALGASADSAEPDWQAAAVLASLRRSFAVITGGPGTGKTTTVVKLLQALALLRPTLRVALAAPTGKAAARLEQALGAQAAKLEALALSPPRTLHRLLGARADAAGFRHDARHPLGCELLIIDEASMVDVELLAATVDALGPDAGLVLVGDKDQLASVESGSVLGDCCRAADLHRAHSPAFAAELGALGGGRIASDAAAPALRDAVVELRRSHRFGSRARIATCAALLREGDAEAVLALLRADAGATDAAELRYRGAPRDVALVLDRHWPRIRAVVDAADPGEALARLQDWRLLSPQRRGRWGVEGLNAAIEARLRQEGCAMRGGQYRGRPLLVLRNDAAAGLANGDVGVVWPDDSGRQMACFALGDQLHRLPLAALPAHESAWASTVHKSQGSEFAEVVVVIGSADGGLLSRELLYTALTRASERVEVWADEAVLRQAIATPARRCTGLAERLGQS